MQRDSVRCSDALEKLAKEAPALWNQMLVQAPLLLLIIVGEVYRWILSYLERERERDYQCKAWHERKVELNYSISNHSGIVGQNQYTLSSQGGVPLRVGESAAARLYSTSKPQRQRRAHSTCIQIHKLQQP